MQHHTGNGRVIILDRDGVINYDADNHIRSAGEWQAIPGSLKAIARLCRKNYRVVVATNQSGIARGYFSINTLNQIHEKMLEELNHFGGEISAIFFCPHSDRMHCACRKPKPGLFFELAERIQCNLREVYAVGDSLRDLQAARAADCKPALVLTGKGEKTAVAIDNGSDIADYADVPRYRDLAEFVDHLLATDPA